MNLKEQLCAAFCAGLQIHEVPAGLAVGTPLAKGDGDLVGFYLISGKNGLWRVEDNGMTVAMLTASGVDVESGERAVEFNRMLAEAGAAYDAEHGELHSDWLEPEAIPAAALRFSALLIRVVDLQLLHPDKVANTFREDVLAALHKRFDDRAVLEEDTSLLPELREFQADAVLTAAGADPLAVFIATSDARIHEAVAARALAKYQFHRAVRVAAVIDAERSKYITLKAQQRARNYLDAAPSFVGDEAASMTRIEEMWLGSIRLLQ